MKKASEILKENGWKPAHEGVHPQETDWIDPEDGVRYSFWQALTIQQARGYTE